MFILSTISIGLGFWSITSMYKSYELKVFKNIKFFGEISSKWPNDLFWTNAYKTYEWC